MSRIRYETTRSVIESGKKVAIRGRIQGIVPLRLIPDVRGGEVRMRHSLMFFCIGLLALLGAGDATAQVYHRYELDPARSFIAFDSGEVSGQLGTSSFPFATLEAQPGTSAVPLWGHFVLAIAPDLVSPGALSLVSGTSDIRPANGNLASPGLGAGPGSAPAAFGIEFEDPFAGVGGQIALRDLVFGLSGFLDVFANGAGPFGLRGNLNWIQARGDYDIDIDIGFESSLPLGPVSLLEGFVDSSTSQFAEVSTGVYEVTLPFFFTLGGFDLPGPVSFAGATASFAGEIVATTVVPEPGVGAALVAGCGWLSALGRRRARS